MNQYSDEQLMIEFQKGQTQACTLLYSRYKHLLMGYFYNNTKSRTRSEDLLQLTFEKLLKYKANYKAESKFKAWILTIARNTFIDDFNRKKKRNETDLEKTAYKIASEEPPSEDERLEQMRRAIALLSSDKRDLISLVKIEGVQYKDAAQIFGTTESNIKVRVFRILKELRTIIASSTEKQL